MDSGPTTFGRKLAHTDKKVRDQAVKTLSAWIQSQPSLSEMQLLKLWKGLFYTFWMSDKPLIQEELAKVLSTMLTKLPDQHKIPYIATFWKTMLREWNGIDRLRLDKFYMFLRKFQFATFKFLAEEGWKTESLESYKTILSSGPLKPNDLKTPDGLTYHTIESTFQELASSLDKELPSEALKIILEAFLSLYVQSTNKLIITKIEEEVLAYLEKTGSEEGQFLVDADAVIAVIEKHLSSENLSEKKKNTLNVLMDRFSKLPKRVVLVETNGSVADKDALNPSEALVTPQRKNKKKNKKRLATETPVDSETSEKKRVRWSLNANQTVTFVKRLPVTSISGSQDVKVSPSVQPIKATLKNKKPLAQSNGNAKLIGMKNKKLKRAKAADFM